MKAMVYSRYGGPEVVTPAEIATPAPGPGEVLVKIEAATVTTADWRLRAAAFPGITALPGRLMVGLFRPRKPVLGVEFAGTVAAAGPGAARFAPGAEVFGFSGGGAHAEYLVMREDGAIAPRPAGLTAAEAAALPFGGLSALVFLRDVAGLRPGQRVAIVGATGGVGVYAVQIARHMGAEVTAIASAAHGDLARRLGAARVIDYRAEDFTQGAARYDLVLDMVGATRFRDLRRVLAPKGLFVPLNFGLTEMLQAVATAPLGGRRVKVAVSGDTRADLETLAEMVEAGALRPVIERRYPLARIAEAYAHVEGRHRAGAVVLDVAGAAA
jgi:NADPH:quinone reductase-like Zn-dependent oxidoreductase